MNERRTFLSALTGAIASLFLGRVAPKVAAAADVPAADLSELAITDAELETLDAIRASLRVWNYTHTIKAGEKTLRGARGMPMFAWRNADGSTRPIFPERVHYFEESGERYEMYVFDKYDESQKLGDL